MPIIPVLPVPLHQHAIVMTFASRRAGVVLAYLSPTPARNPKGGRWQSLARPDVLPELPVVKKPMRETHRDRAAYADASREYAAYREALDQMKKEHAQKMTAFNEQYPSYGKLLKNAPDDPTARLNKQHPIPSIGKRPVTMDCDSWAVELAARQATRDAVLVHRHDVQSSATFKEEAAAYAIYVQGIHQFGMQLFRPFNDKKCSKGWSPSMSVSTDRVSISITYEKTVTMPVELQTGVRKARPRPPEDLLESGDTYDPDATTMVDGVLVLGVDPGRTQIVTVVCIDAAGRKHSWQLSRGEYYTKGLILRENKRQANRYKGLTSSFASLAAHGGALRTNESSAMQEYLSKYVAFDERWWAVALGRPESRAKMQRYIAKKSVIARFFARLHREASKLLEPGQRLNVAYGSAVMTMPSSGRGEVAIPTTGAYAACVRQFGKTNVSEEWEHNTTAVRWQTGLPYEKVYKVIDSGGKEWLHHTGAKTRTPFVTPEHQARVTEWTERAKVKAKRRKGGTNVTVLTGANPRRTRRDDVATEEKERARYPKCRGLRFCTETRMFYDRDRSSARAIAGLRCLTLGGFGRPAVFKRAAAAA